MGIVILIVCNAQSLQICDRLLLFAYLIYEKAKTSIGISLIHNLFGKRYVIIGFIFD